MSLSAPLAANYATGVHWRRFAVVYFIATVLVTALSWVLGAFNIALPVSGMAPGVVFAAMQYVAALVLLIVISRRGANP